MRKRWKAVASLEKTTVRIKPQAITPSMLSEASVTVVATCVGPVQGKMWRHLLAGQSTPRAQ